MTDKLTPPTEPTYALTGEPVALEHINAYKEGWYDGQAAAEQQIEALKAQLAAVTAASTNTEHADNLRGRLMAAARDVSGRHNMNYGFASVVDNGLILQSSVKADSFDDAKRRLGVSRHKVWALCRAPVDGRGHMFLTSWGEA